jgi:hypothetical protein
MFDAADLIFENGCQWVGTFVKRASHRHRGVSFHLATHIVVNCLSPNPERPGPLGTVEVNDAVIEAACIRAFGRSGLGTTVLLAAEDFIVT